MNTCFKYFFFAGICRYIIQFGEKKKEKNYENENCFLLEIVDVQS